MRTLKLPPGVFMQLANRHALRAWLDYRDMSYADLGSLVGVSKQFIGKLATGEKTTCSPEVAHKIEMVLLPPPSERRPSDLPLFVERGFSNLGVKSPQKRRSLLRESSHSKKPSRCVAAGRLGGPGSPPSP